MGSSWSRETAWSGTSDWIVTQNEVKGALSGFEAWQKEQDASKVNQRALPTNGPLLDRMGGADYVKRVAERFYHKLYADEQLAPFLGEHDVVSLRAKQNAFLIWAFGPPNRPYPGRHLRTAHLRLIKQKGFTVEHFEMGLKHFEEALKEMDAPPSVVRDALMKLRPYKTVVFTPSSARDAEEELRWVKEERMRAQREQRALHKTHSTASATSVGSGTAAPAGGAAGGVAAEGGSAGRAVSRSADSGTSAPRPPAGSAPGTADQGAAAAAQASQQHGSGTGGISDSDQSVSSSAAARAAGPQCPFTGGRVSRPSSSTVVVPPASTSADNSVTTPTSEAAPSPVATPTRSTPPKGPSGAASGGPPLSRLSGSQLFPPPFPAGGVNSPARGSGRAGPGSASGSFSGPSGGVMAAAAPGLLGGTGSGHGSFSSSQVPLPPALAGLPPPPPLPPLHMLATRGAGNGPPSGSGTPRSTSQRGMAVGGSAQAVSLSGALPSGSAGGCAVGSPLASAGGSGAFSRRSGGRSSFDFGSGPSTIPGVRQPSPSHLSQMTPGSMPGGVVSAAAEVAAAPSSSPVVRAAPSMAWAASAATGAKSGPPKAAAAANAPAAAAAGGDVSGGLKKLAPPAAAAREGSDAAAAAAAAAQQPRPVERWAQPAAATPGSGGGGGAGSGSATAGTGTGTAGTGSHSPNYHMQFMKPPSPGHMSSGMSSPGAMKRLA